MNTTIKNLIEAALAIVEANISIGSGPNHPKTDLWSAALRRLDEAAEAYLNNQ